MNKSLIIVLLLAFGIGGYFLVGNKSSEKETMEEKAVTEDGVTEKDSMETEEKMTDESHAGGEYKKYSEKEFNADSSKKRIYFFHATWCPSCKQADKDISKRLDELPEDVVIYKTDYDSQRDLKKKYGVTYQHTFVQVDENGKEVMKWNGGDVDELLKRIK